MSILRKGHVTLSTLGVKGHIKYKPLLTSPELQLLTNPQTTRP